MDDAIASAWWRREILPVHLRRLLLGAAAKHEGPMKTSIQFRLNGEEVATFADSGANLLDVLREGVGDLSVKGGCWQGTCGTCTVLIDGAPRLSCVTLAESCDGKSIETVAGLRRGVDLHPLQTRLHGALRRPVRLLHAGHADGGQGAPRPQSQPDPRERRRRDLRQHLPLHRL